jgi:hypothetical protein
MARTAASKSAKMAFSFISKFSIDLKHEARHLYLQLGSPQRVVTSLSSV